MWPKVQARGASSRTGETQRWTKRVRIRKVEPLPAPLQLAAPSMYCFVKVYTVNEGHVTYPSCCDTARNVHRPRRQHTRVSPARDDPGAGAEQREQGVPGVRDLPHAVLPLAEAIPRLWAGWPSSASAGPTPGTPAVAERPGRAGHPGAGSGLADLGPGSVGRPTPSSGTWWAAPC